MLVWLAGVDSQLASTSPSPAIVFARWTYAEASAADSAQIPLPLPASLGRGNMTSNWDDPSRITYSSRGLGFSCDIRGQASNGRYLAFTFDSTGYQQLLLSLEFIYGWDDGFDTFEVQTSTDGNNYVTRVAYSSTVATFVRVTLDLRSCSELDNLASAEVRLVFSGATTTNGGSKIDNVAFGGQALPSPSASPSPTQSPSASVTSSPSNSPSNMPSPSPTESPSSTPSPSSTNSPTQTPSNTPSPSSSISPTQSPSNAPSPSSTSSPTPSPSRSQTPSPTRSPTSSPTTSPSFCLGSTLRTMTTDEASARQYVRNFLFLGLTGAQPSFADSLSQPDRLATCRFEADGVPLMTGFNARKASAEDPATIRTRLRVASVPCPVVSSYVELSYTGSAVNAVLQWRGESVSVLDSVTHFGVGVWNQPGGDGAPTFLVSLVRVANNLGACPPNPLPDFYS